MLRGCVAGWMDGRLPYADQWGGREKEREKDIH